MISSILTDTKLLKSMGSIYWYRLELWWICDSSCSCPKTKNETRHKTRPEFFFQNMMMGFSLWNIWRSEILVSTWWFSFLQATLMTSEFNMSVAWFLVSTIAVIMGRPQSTITKQWWQSQGLFSCPLFSFSSRVIYIYIYIYIYIIFSPSYPSTYFFSQVELKERAGLQSASSMIF